jgi:hypothetical protein
MKFTPDLTYSIIERNHAIAVSVRHFRVGGIIGLPNLTGAVTIKTAVQVAVQYHSSGQNLQAEVIYRSILAENPTYPDALHLLGMLFYQKGDLVSAVDYVERAIQSSVPAQSQAFYSTLGDPCRGVCLASIATYSMLFGS